MDQKTGSQLPIHFHDELPYLIAANAPFQPGVSGTLDRYEESGYRIKVTREQ